MSRPRRRLRAAPAALALAILSAQGLWADDEDIFAEGAFDTAVAAGQASEDANRLTWLGGVSLASTSTLTLAPEAEAWASGSNFVGKGFLKANAPALGTLYLSYTYRHTLWASTNDPVFSAAYEAQKLDPSEPDLTLSEFHLSFDLGKVVFIRVGNQLLDWGASAVWSPADFVNRRSADPASPLDVRSGKPGIRVHVPFSGGNLFVFADASASIDSSGVPQDLTRKGTVAAKVDKTLAGWNVGLVGRSGWDAGTQAGLTLSGALLGIDLWGEYGARLPVGSQDFSWAASLGGERTFGTDSEWTLRAEGFWNPDGQGNVDLTAAEVTSGAYTAYYWGRAYVYGEVVKKKALGPDISASLSSTANLADQSWTATASLRTAFPKTIPFSLYLQRQGGPAQREFTLATQGEAWILGLRSVVEF